MDVVRRDRVGHQPVAGEIDGRQRPVAGNSATGDRWVPEVFIIIV
jgi:hypothetical protein